MKEKENKAPEQPETEQAPEKKPEKKEKKPKGPTLEEIRADYEKALQEKDDKFMRLAAEYDNFRKRSSREREGVYADATIDAVKELLPVLDNLERALAQENASAEDLGKGLKMTLDQFAKAFEKLGVEPFGTRGEEFDPQIHNAVMQAEDGEDIRPLGFINGDFIYGKINPSDKGQDVSGREIEPMYEVEIRNSENEEEAKYSFIDQGLYTSDILIEDNLLTLNRVEKSGDRYQTASQEYITNNTERMETKVTVEIYSADVMEKQVRLTLSEGVGDLEPKTIKADFAADGRTLTLMLGENSGGMKFYVYGMGGFAGMYDRAGDAVQEAERISGVVVSSDQHYVWEKGNRNLSYSTETPVFVKEGDETSLEACERYMQSYEAHQIDLTGCTLEQILYVIGKGRPVTALISSDHAVMLTGYTTTDITYIDPDMGQEYTVGISTMEDMTEAGGDVFIGYIR